MAGTYRYQHGDKPVEGYTILRGIGRGGFGEVYYAISDGGREVALKAIQQNHDIELRGVRHCINLKNPHLVSIFDVKKAADGAPFVIMEYVAGPSLRDILGRDGHGVGPEKAAYLLREISKGLGYLHERGIVHRDLKPENIFYEDGYAKIGDYGLSKYISVSRQSGQTISVGTVHYMAPEIGSGNYHQAIDLYALGIIFYELLTGTVPFNGDSMSEILMKHLTMEPDVSVLEPPFRPIVKKALAKSPAERFQSAREMVDAVFADAGLSAKVTGIDPQSFMSSYHVPAGAAADAAGQLRGAETTPLPPPRAASPAPPRAPAQPAPAAADPGGATGPGGRWLDQRFVPGLATAGAMAFALGLLTKNSSPMAVTGHFVLITTVAAAILGVEHWIVPRFQITSDIVRRFVTFGLGGPIMAGAVAMLTTAFGVPGDFTRCLPGLLAGLLFVDWSARARPHRTEQVSIGMAFSAGLFGLVAGAIVANTRGLIPGFGLLAALSLVVNAVSPFVPISTRRKDKNAPGGNPDASTAQHPPPPGLQNGSPDLRFAPTAPVSPAASTAPLLLMAPAAPGAATDTSRRNTLPPPLPAPLLPRTKLVRPLEGVVLGGVCAGIAQRYGWDVVWVRLIWALLSVTVPLGILAYFVLWMAMPEAAAPPKPPRPARPPRARRPGLFRRVFWFGLAALLFAGGLALAYRALAYPVPGNASSLIALVAFNACGALALLRGRAAGRAERSCVRSRAPGSAWAALGKVLVAVALAAAALHATVVTGLGTAILVAADLDARPRLVDGLFNVFRDPALNLLSLATFSVGAFCLLFSRGWGGTAHVLRGLLGWAGLGLVSSICLSLVLRLIRVSPFLEVSSNAQLTELTWAVIAGFGALGLFSLFLLAWPGRTTRETASQTASGTLRAAEKSVA